MNLPYRVRPGAGFVVVVIVVLASAGFLAFGARTPVLDEVWKMQIELETGTRGPLDDAEFDAFQDTLLRYPEFADNLVDGSHGIISAHESGLVDGGYVYLVRKSKADPGVVKVVSARNNGKDVSLRISSRGFSVEGKAARQPASIFRLPDSGPFPQLIEVRAKKKGKARVMNRPFTVSLEAAP